MAHFIVAYGRLWLFICWVTLKKVTLLNVTQKIKVTIDQKPQFGHNEMRHVNRLKENTAYICKCDLRLRLSKEAAYTVYANGVWPLLRLLSVRRGADRWPCCPSMSNPSTSPWSAWPDGSEWRDNRIAAQHLHRDLVRPSSG